MKRDHNTIVVAPTAEKEIVIVPPTNFVRINKKCGKVVSHLNSTCDEQMRVERDKKQKVMMSHIETERKKLHSSSTARV